MFEHQPIRKAFFTPDGTFRDEIAEIITFPLETEWFSQRAILTQNGYLRNISYFLEWIYTADFDSDSKYNILNLYQEYRVNVCGVKTGSTGVNVIKIMIKVFLASKEYLENAVRTFCNLIIQRHRPLPNHNSKQPNLVSWFIDIPWLKYEISNKELLQLGSPRILTESFIYTISTILFELIETKKKIKFVVDSHNKKIRFEDYKNRKEKRFKRRLFLKELFERIIREPKFDDQGLREIFLMDCISDDKNRILIQEIIEDTALTPQEKKRQVASINRLLFNRPNILAPRDDCIHSIFEENLFSFICAWLAIQPYDIHNLKRSHFVVVSDENGRPMLIKCSYHKGRAGVVHEPPTIATNSIIGKAILSYLEIFQDDDQLISLKVTHTNNLTFGSISTSKLLALCIESGHFSTKVNRQLKSNSTSDIFSKAYLTLFRNHDQTFTEWNRSRKRKSLKHNSIELYKDHVKKWLPQGLFSLGHIKNSSVHAKSDKFRIDDPVNENSHTSETEYKNYLTDSNKEWMNINGAVTRLVLKKVGEAFNPDLKLHATIVRNKHLQTQFEQSLVDSFNEDSSPLRIRNTPDLILKNHVVLDTPETVLFMRHYIDQVISKMHILVTRNLRFFELTALPTAEWMETILATKLSPKVVIAGDKQYEKIKSLLPDLFTSDINAGDLN